MEQPTDSGASIRTHDPRVTSLIAWAMGILSVSIIAMGSWIASSITNLNHAVTRLVVQNEQVFNRLDRNDLRDDRQDIEIKDVERDIAVIEGRIHRGRAPDGGPPLGN